ncbi:MAG: CDP-alcohol phosphatidyltransferase family protein [Candidatus Njordarchaeales archaeon]
MINKEKWTHIQQLQKGKHLMSKLHKPLEDIIVYLLYDLDFISADHISIITYILAFYVAYLFLKTNILYALILAFIVGILDGVDGKIARLRKRKTYIGKLEHSMDMLYEQTWYATYTWCLWTLYSSSQYLALGMIFLILDSFVRHIYNTFWIATGKSLKYSGGIAEKITMIDGRRSVYVLHMIIWYIIGKFNYSIYTILIHCGATAIAYFIISMKYLYKTTNLPN